MSKIMYYIIHAGEDRNIAIEISNELIKMIKTDKSDALLLQKLEYAYKDAVMLLM